MATVPVIDPWGDAPGPWNKAAAVMRAARASDADIVIVADADVWTTAIAAAVDAVLVGAPWAVPHARVHRLTEAATAAVRAGQHHINLETVEPPYRGVAGGGIVVLPRDTLLEVPLDVRFEGWGQEDVSWAIALHTLAGRAWRGSADLIHLWHPPQPRVSRRTGSLAGSRLARRYAAARGNPDQMRALLAEVTYDAQRTDQPTVHHHAPVSGH